ncbi:MAG TPA: carboxypeptidase-like regulatory domain-containing protein [Thermoanaerobaculia bacterium]
MPRVTFAPLLCFVSVPLAAADVHQVRISVDPQQQVKAITIRGGDRTESVSVRNGRIAVPADLPLPWSLGMLRFEAAHYTAADLEQKRPWVIRELGTLEGRLAHKSGERFVWLLQQGDSEVLEREITLAPDGAFRLTLPAGTYHGALIGTASATRIRSGIVVRPGQTTALGAIATEAAVPVSVRVLDARSRKPVAGARVVWDPPDDILNSAPLRKLYAKRWGAVTNSSGIAAIAAVGPLPHSVRWRVEANTYAPAQTLRMQLREPKRVTLPDVQLRQEPAVVVRVQYPRRDEEGLEKCTLVAGEIRDPHSTSLVPVSRTKLREGDSRFEFSSYGRKRVWIENKAGKTIFYRDFEVTEETTLVDLMLQPIEIHGRVTQRGKAVSDVLVALADPHNGRVMLAQAPVDDDGEYRLTTWQSGQLHLYTISRRAGAGKSIGAASIRVDTESRTDVRADLAIPAAGFSIRVVDAASGSPVRASVDVRNRYDSGGGGMGSEETDAEGRLEVSGNAEGTAKLHITAKGYRAADVEIGIRNDAPEQTVRLERGGIVSGRVVNVHGAPIAGARILGGFPDEQDPQSFYRTTSDAQGRFELDPGPPPGTPFYVVAAGHALAITTLRADQPTTVVLHPPSSSVVSLRENNAPPEKVFLVMAAPSGQSFIPLGALEELAELSGMDLYQLCGSSPDGDVVLPELLGPGTYDLHLVRRGRPFTYQRIGSITTPLRRNVVMSLPSAP